MTECIPSEILSRISRNLELATGIKFEGVSLNTVILSCIFPLSQEIPELTSLLKSLRGCSDIALSKETIEKQITEKSKKDMLTALNWVYNSITNSDTTPVIVNPNETPKYATQNKRPVGFSSVSNEIEVDIDLEEVRRQTVMPVKPTVSPVKPTVSPVKSLSINSNEIEADIDLDSIESTTEILKQVRKENPVAPTREVTHTPTAFEIQTLDINDDREEIPFEELDESSFLRGVLAGTGEYDSIPKTTFDLDY